MAPKRGLIVSQMARGTEEKANCLGHRDDRRTIGWVGTPKGTQIRAQLNAYGAKMTCGTHMNLDCLAVQFVAYGTTCKHQS